MWEHVGALEGHVGQAVSLRVLTAERQRCFGDVDTLHARRSSLGRVEPESARVAKPVEHRAPGREPRYRLPIVTLVVVETRLLTFLNVHQKCQAVLLNRQVGRRSFAGE